jgi:hypothetical protein
MSSAVEAAQAERIAQLRRKVAWQVSTAYGLELEEPPRTLVPTALDRPVAVAVKTEPAPQPEQAPEPEPVRIPAAVPAPGELPTLDELERLVAAAADADPLRAEEWRWYLFYLRGFARADGTLDDGFRLLVETAFAPLLRPAA